MNFLISNKFFAAPAHPYMTEQNIDAFARSLDIVSGVNEYGYPLRDLQLTFNYFHAQDAAVNYGQFGDLNPRMLFNFSTVPTGDKNHIDMYLNHPADNAGDDTGGYIVFDTDPQEDNDPSLCDEVETNDISVKVGYRSYRVPGQAADTSEPDPDWHTNGRANLARINHESQHIMFASRTSGTSVNGTLGFPNETFAMAAEYLSGFSARNTERSIYNSIYDRPLVLIPTADLPADGQPFDRNFLVGAGYNHWYLWSAYLLQQFRGADTTSIYDDLLYEWVRTRNVTVYNNQMWGLAKALEAAKYSSLGVSATGAERLRNLFHNYALAKWINNPSLGEKYGFTRGVVPSFTTTFFDNTFNPCARSSALEVPPRFLVDASRMTSDLTYGIGSTWTVTDTNQGAGCNQNVLSADTIGVWLYGTDYLQFDADPYFTTNGKQNTFRCRISWDPSKYPGGGSRNNLRVSAVTYSTGGDSLYRKGAFATGIVDAFVDSLHGFAQVWIPNFGTSVKSVAVVIDMGEDIPPSSGQNPRKFYYGYSFGVDASASLATVPLNLTATRSPGQGFNALQWTDPGACGTSGFSIQRSVNASGGFSTIGTVPGGTFARNDTVTYAAELLFYRVVANGAPACSSNLASVGGVGGNQTIGGTLYLSGDLTITSIGSVLTILPGTTIRCAANWDSQQGGNDPGKVEVQLTSSSNIQAIGTSADSIRWMSAAASPAPGDWRGIYLILSPSSRFEYNAIAHAVHGIQTYWQSHVTVDHSTIRHSQFYGVWTTFGSSTTILNSVLEQNHGAEIATTQALCTVRNCFLHYSSLLSMGAVDDGIVYTAYAGGILRKNRIAGVGMGVYCATNSDPTLVGEDNGVDSLKYGRNDILDFRYWGVRTYDEGIPELGPTNSPANYLAGRNNVFSRTYPGAIWVEHSSTAIQLSARNNYWGASSPDLSRFVGNILGPNQYYLSQFDSPAGPSTYYPGYNLAGSLTAPEDAYYASLEKEITGDLEGAVAGYRAVVATQDGSDLAPRALSRLMSIQLRRGRAVDEISPASTIAFTSSNVALARVAKRFRPGLLLSAGQVQAAYRAYEDLLAEPQIDHAGVLFEMAIQKGLIVGDPAGARAAISELQAICHDYHILKHARAMLQEVVGSAIWVDIAEPAPQLASARTLSRDEFSLEQNYPNPTNPQTRFAFTLPRSGRVRLRLFTVDGRLLHSIVDGVLPAGRHEVLWDGTSSRGQRVASGVYYYRLETEEGSLSRKLLVLK